MQRTGSELVYEQYKNLCSSLLLAFSLISPWSSLGANSKVRQFGAQGPSTVAPAAGARPRGQGAATSELLSKRLKSNQTWRD